MSGYFFHPKKSRLWKKIHFLRCRMWPTVSCSLCLKMNGVSFFSDRTLGAWAIKDHYSSSKCEDDFVFDPELGTSCDHLVIEVVLERRHPLPFDLEPTFFTFSSLRLVLSTIYRMVTQRPCSPGQNCGVLEYHTPKKFLWGVFKMKLLMTLVLLYHQEFYFEYSTSKNFSEYGIQKLQNSDQVNGPKAKFHFQKYKST